MYNKLFAITLVLLFLQGCTDKTKNDDNSITNDIKNFGKIFKVLNSNHYFSNNDDDENETQNPAPFYRSIQEVEPCEDGGTNTFTIPDTFAFILVESDNCIENGINTNASINLSRPSGKITVFDFNKNSTFEAIETHRINTIFKNSKIVFETISDSIEKITSNLKGTIYTGQAYETSDLVQYQTSTETTESSYEVSGRYIENGISYRVDIAYDASVTPMILDKNDTFISGKAKFFNDKNEHITLKIIEDDKLKISLDSDNDGVDDYSEII